MKMGGGQNQPDFQLADIIAGSHDAYLRQWATDAKTWGHPFMIRFAHEMNGDWFPWGEDTNGNARGQFVQAWRRVHGIFTSVGARNVSWVWCPNMDFPASPRPTYASVYPGDAYVDWTCLDGYNWGPNYPKNGGWNPFASLFGYSYNNLLAVAPSKPVMIAEFASTENGGSKAGWIADALSVQIPVAFPRIKAVLWYNRIDKGMDWPIESSQGSINAWKAAIAAPYYLRNQFGALEMPSEGQAVPEP
jgi:beta-mannanase